MTSRTTKLKVLWTEEQMKRLRAITGSLLVERAAASKDTEDAASRIMELDGSIWELFGWDSGGEIRADKVKRAAYDAALLVKATDEFGPPRGQLGPTVYGALESENHHLANETLEKFGYFGSTSYELRWPED